MFIVEGVMIICIVVVRVGIPAVVLMHTLFFLGAKAPKKSANADFRKSAREFFENLHTSL